LKKKFKKIISKNKIIIIIISVIVTIAGGTYAWFVSTQSSQTEFTAGTVAIALENTLSAPVKTLPGENVTGNISINNTSNINVFLRIKISVDESGGGFYQGTDTFADIFTLTVGSTWTKIGDWYYYEGPLTPGTNLSNILTAFSLSGTMSNDYQNKSFILKLDAEAIQGTTAAVTALWINTAQITSQEATTLGFIN
jgi:predicted ribosomally synthesized peptide with SipW-like signal peptide